MAEKGDSQPIRVRNGSFRVWQLIVGALVAAVVGMFVGNFVPVVQGAAALAALEKRMDENFQEVRADIRALDSKIDKSMAAHVAAPAHGNALQLLIQHGNSLSDHEARIRALERKP